MRVGVFIPYHHFLSKYVGSVVQSVVGCHEVLLLSADFKKDLQQNVRNAGVQRLQHCDWVFTLDADEIIVPKDVSKLLLKVDGTQYDAVFCPVIHYTKDLCHRYITNSEHKPVILVAPKKVEFYETRCVRYNIPLFVKDVYIHHLGFTYDDNIIEWKRNNYWNVGNPNEVSDIMSCEQEPFIMPKEVRDLLCMKK